MASIRWHRKNCFLFLLLLIYPAVSFAKDPVLAPLPTPVSNNAVAISYGTTAGVKLFSFMGIGPKKTWDALTTSAYEMDLKTGTWDERRPVPGVSGRLAASAVALGGQVFIFGGYVVDEHGEETTLSDVNVYVPFEDRYYRAKDMPVPVDDAVVGLYRDRWIYLIGGWSKNEAVRNVQVYDTEKDQWLQATPIPGTPVFGHAGAILGDSIIFVDGAYKNPDGNGPKNWLRTNAGWGSFRIRRRATSRRLSGRSCRRIRAMRTTGSERARNNQGKKRAKFIFPVELIILTTTTVLVITASPPSLLR